MRSSSLIVLVVHLLSSLHLSTSQIECNKPGANYKGKKTSCTVYYGGETPRVEIFSQGSSPSVAVAFVKGNFPTKFILARGNSKIKECRTKSGLNFGKLPKWVDSGDAENVSKHLKHHCFLEDKKDILNGAYPYQVIHTVTMNPKNGPSPRGFTTKKIGYALPRRNDVIILKDSSSVINACTFCSTLSFGLGQRSLVTTTHLRSYLAQALVSP